MALGMESVFVRNERDELYAEYKRRIDMRAVLDHYAPDNTNEQGDEVIHSCLIDRVDPHHVNGDTNPSASANLVKKTYNCYGYGGGDVFWLICQMEGKEYFHEIVPFLGQFLGDATMSKADFLDELKRLFEGDPKPEKPPVYHERVLRNWALYHPYLRTRGVTKEAAERLQLGYDETGVRITIPHWVDGKLMGWQRRSLSDPRWPTTPPDPVRRNGEVVGYVDPPPKYKNTTLFPKNETVYNLDRVRARGHRKIIVVESPMSVAKAESLMADDSDRLSAVVSTFGAKVGDAQMALLRGFDRVTVYFDNDSAGAKGALRLIDGLYRHTKVEYVEAEQGKDMADYDTVSDLDRILDAAVPAFIALPKLEREHGRRKA